ncbi:succinyl-diaminopimelate desuccinylase [Corynebacterium phocae]|uniref:Succinyl-diaminopimelate desuccinylase n=1 Tax=Corynebacterium phocae TaxID=161895 RepID=A0A1L7D421_9CORY|nr:succinyl-diaminopimelate desuccinylase [Corynebacterium phocae]APT92817.1 succinyl-diaminopimelate desuccinylase [Corynebacterium phocae]KAA8723135.1 succinyl-diaminopimelate desuccinylase [Corynebacterium phocae]
MTLDLCSDPIELTRALVDIPSPSHHEEEIADAVEAALAALPVEVFRYGNTVCARTNFGRKSRIILAGHLDTVPLADNVPSRTLDGVMHGCGTVDMKSGLAVYLHAFAQLAGREDIKHDLTVIAYEAEEVADEYNGLRHLQQDHPEWLRGDLALLGEPSGAIIEAGCQGTIRLRVTARGTRAHSGRAWLGDNAAHRLAPVISNIANYRPRDAVDIDGLSYREGLNIVHLESGVATNTIPDEAWLFVNFRFAPDRSLEDAMAHVREVVGQHHGVDIEVDDACSAAKPGLSQPGAAALIQAVGGQVRPKFGWTDVARFSEMGTPAVNFGPGDPGYAHKKDEQVPLEQITQVSKALIAYLTT